MPLARHFTIVAIIVVIGVVFVLQQLSDDNLYGYCVVPLQVGAAWSSLLAGELGAEAAQALSTLFTSTLLHSGVEHIVMNLVFLWLFGSLASEHLGVWWALLVFVVTGIAGAVLHVVLNQESPIPMLGASGAVMGFEGLYLGLALQWRLDWPDVWPIAHPIPPLQLAVVAVVGFALDVYGLANQGHGVAYGAHIGGLLTGLLIAAVLTSWFPSEEAFARSVIGGRKVRRR